MTWSARALLYSGRPDPSWPLDELRVSELLALWDALPPAPSPAGGSGRLGYRGALLVAPDGLTWLAAEGRVQHAGRGGTESRRDPERRFERALLKSAPPGMLPPSLD